MGFCMVDPLHTPRQTCSAMGFPGKTMNTAFNDEIEAVRPYDWCVTTPWVFHTAHPMHAILTPHAPSHRSRSPPVKLRPGNRTYPGAAQITTSRSGAASPAATATCPAPILGAAAR